MYDPNPYHDKARAHDDDGEAEEENEQDVAAGIERHLQRMKSAPLRWYCPACNQALLAQSVGNDDDGAFCRKCGGPVEGPGRY